MSLKFFKWLYFPNIEPAKRPKPEVVQNLPKLRRLEISGYEPNDMWDAEDNLIFSKVLPKLKRQMLSWNGGRYGC